MGDSLPRVGQGDKERLEFKLFSQLKSIVGWMMGMGCRDSVTSGASTSLRRGVTASPTPHTQLLHAPKSHFPSKISTCWQPGEYLKKQTVAGDVL